MTYEDFIESKRHLLVDSGFDPVYMPDMAFDFQREIITRAVKRGRMAVFADTGLGKTLIQLAIAHNVVKKENAKVLILTPIAVAFQFIKEAEKMGVPNVYHSRDGSIDGDIIIANYERLHYFNPSDFKCVMLDESSILKNFQGSIKRRVTAFMKKTKYRFLSTATPSPNDYIELGTSSEALGYMGYMDMLTTFFKNNQNSVSSLGADRIGEKFYLKPHAEDDFFSWVSQWAIMIRKPSDIGDFSDDKYILPALNVNTHVVKNQSLIDVDGQVQLFNIVARTFQEIRHEQKQTITERCEKAVDLANGNTSVYWVNRNDESSMIAKIDDLCLEITGSMSIDQKEERLLAFADGQVDRIVTKAKITGMGLNWQHCSHTTFFPTFSYEQYYQAIRRFWRFGQDKDVTVDLVISDGQKRVLQAIREKSKRADDMYRKLTNAVNRSYNKQYREFNQSIKKPLFI